MSKYIYIYIYLDQRLLPTRQRTNKQLVIVIIIANKLSFVYIIFVWNVITLKILVKVLMEMTNMLVHLVMDTFDILFTHSLPQACNFVHFPTT